MTNERENKDTRPQNVHHSIAKMTELLAHTGISKDKVMKVTNKADDKGFKFRGIDDVRNVIAPLQKECCLNILPSVIKRLAEDKKTTSTWDGKTTEKTSIWVNLEVEFEFINTVDFSSTKKIFFGEGSDSSDKASQKAMSQAYKTMAINTFNIPTEGEADDEQKNIEVVSEKRAGEFNSIDELKQYKENCIMAFESATTVNQLKETEGFYHDKLVLMANSSNADEKKARAEISNVYLNKLNSIKELTKGNKL